MSKTAVIVALGFRAGPSAWQKATGVDRRQLVRRFSQYGWSGEDTVLTPAGADRGSCDNFRRDDIIASIQANGGVSVAEEAAVNETSQSFGSEENAEPVGAGASEAPQGYQNGMMYR